MYDRMINPRDLDPKLLKGKRMNTTTGEIYASMAEAQAAARPGEQIIPLSRATARQILESRGNRKKDRQAERTRANIAKNLKRRKRPVPRQIL